MDDDTSIDNVLEFRQPTVPRVKGSMVLSFRVNKPSCEHDSLVVDLDARTIECDVCGAQVEAWDIIRSWAEKDLRICRAVGFYERRRNELNGEVQLLAKEKKSLEDSIRRLKIKAAKEEARHG
jgi:hypothetical protein